MRLRLSTQRASLVVWEVSWQDPISNSVNVRRYLLEIEATRSKEEVRPVNLSCGGCWVRGSGLVSTGPGLLLGGPQRPSPFVTP